MIAQTQMVLGKSVKRKSSTSSQILSTKEVEKENILEKNYKILREKCIFNTSQTYLMIEFSFLIEDLIGTMFHRFTCQKMPCLPNTDLNSSQEIGCIYFVLISYLVPVSFMAKNLSQFCT